MKNQRRSLSPSPAALRRGFTLPELLMVVALVAVLAAVGTMAYRTTIDKAEGVASIGKIKKIGGALNAYVGVEGTWPQEPDGDNINTGQIWEWWFKEMEDKAGLQIEDWFSSAHLRRVNQMRKELGQGGLSEKSYGKDDELKIPTFVPTKFNYGPFEPYRDANQPWVMESGEYRTDGMLIYLPDGAVHKVMSISAMNALRSGR